MEKPMLAHSWDKYSHKIEYPCYVQPKLDGMRCLAVREGDTIRYYSRALKEVKTVRHLDARLLQVMKDGDVFDGELYLHGTDFQKLISLVKREQDGTKEVKFNVYDMYSDLPFNVRHYELSRLGIDLVPNTLCRSEEDIEKVHREFVSAGYEGTMIRNINSEYKHARSFDLLKKKDWFDEEYTIVDIVEGKGKFKGCAVFICINESKTFAVTSPGTVESKRRFWEEKSAYIGREVTVKYQEKTNAGIPRFPICVGVRDYE